MSYVNSVSVFPTELTLKVGQWYHDAHVKFDSPSGTYPTVTWRSSNLNVATVNEQSGYIYAKAVGTVRIYATATDGSGKEDFCCLTVVPSVYIDKVEVNKSCITLYKGNTYDLSASVLPEDADNKTIRWTSCNPCIATVDAITGRVIAKSAGSVAVYAKAIDGSGKSDFCCVHVKQNSPEKDEDKGTTKVPEGTVADPIDVYTGAHLLQKTIINLFGGRENKLIIKYDSTRLARGVFGIGWYHNFEKSLAIIGNDAYVFDNPSVYSRYVRVGESSEYNCVAANKNGYKLTVDNTQPYPYIIDCNSTGVEYYDGNGLLAKIVDHMGFETSIIYTDTMITITEEVSGKKIYLEKGTDGNIVRVYDDFSRQASFIYDNNLLISISDLNGNQNTYTYNEDGQVLTGTDSKGICYFTNTYDEFGRVSTQKDAISSSIPSTFVYEDNKRIITDRNGNQSIRMFDENGLLTRYTDELGNVKRYTYDEHFNVIKETDANGNYIERIYNSFNKPSRVTDKNGNKTYYSYDSKGNVTRIRYPEINGEVPEERFEYNERNQLIKYTDLRGTVTIYTYDSMAMPASKKVGSRNAIQYSYQNGLLVSQTDARGNTTKYTHNSLGQITSITDATNNVTSYEYDTFGNLIRTTDANGKTIINTYDGNYQKISVTDANGNKTEYSYNGNLKNDIVHLPDGNTIRYEFDGEDRPVKVIDQAGNVVTTEYDKVGRIVSKHFPDGTEYRYEYDKVGNVIKETNPKGAAITKTYDANGNVLSVTDDNGNIIRNQYNAYGKPVRKANAVSGTTIYTYSKAGDLITETDASGCTKKYSYDAYGNKVSATDAKGNTTTYMYDANNNLISVCDALGNTTIYTYNCLNQLVSVKNVNNNTITYGYDALGRRTTITDAKGNVFTTVYDANGNVLKTIDSKGNTISETSYNCLNLPASVIDATGKTTTFTYNALGKVATVTDSMNHRQENTYDSIGSVVAVKDANNGVSTVQYDMLGNIVSLSGPLGGTTNFTYDNVGRLISETTSSGGVITYGYNEMNIKESVTNARGQNKKIFYDVGGRVTGVITEEDSISYTYDENGNVTSVTDSNGSIKREYDAINRVTKYTDTYGNNICYEYDAVGNLVRLVYPDKTAVRYSYDANNNLVSVIDWANRKTTYTYDSNNRVIGETKPDGSITTKVYDTKQRIVSAVEKTHSGKIITGFEYVYDSLGRIAEEKILADNVKLCYTYDELGRVVARKTVSLSCGSIVDEELYSYDAAGNIVGAPNDSFSHDSNNRLNVFNGRNVTYDKDGNMLYNGVTTFDYDSSNRVVKACAHKYTYDAENVRIRNVCTDADTIYVYNTNRKLSQLLQKKTNGIITKYVYGIGLIGEEKCCDFRTYHFDYRGSTVAITDICGNMTDAFRYDTYGNVTKHMGKSFVIFGYNGRDGVVTDRNGLVYMRARYYSPQMCRFVNADILHGDISDSTSLNRYSYVNGNPVSFVDPFGLSAERGYPDATTTEGWTVAVLITDKTLPIVGHSEIYFKNENGAWLWTEFNTQENTLGIKNKKSLAQIKYNEAPNVSRFYQNGQFLDNPDNLNYVVLKGDFDNSVARARDYYKNKDFGRYNFLFNNCADYTNKLLDVADIDGMASQIIGDADELISIPVLRELKLSITSSIDSKIKSVSDGLIKKGNDFKGTNVLGDTVGGIMVRAGNFVDVSTNFIGDAVDVYNSLEGVHVDGKKFAYATITNGIVDAGVATINGIKSAWNWMFG